MSGITKIVDERIEQLRREKAELEQREAMLAEREAQLAGQETLPADDIPSELFEPLTEEEVEYLSPPQEEDGFAASLLEEDINEMPVEMTPPSEEEVEDIPVFTPPTEEPQKESEKKASGGKRGRGRPRKGEEVTPPVSISNKLNASAAARPFKPGLAAETDAWRKGQIDITRMRATQLAELAEAEARKLSLLEGMMEEKAALELAVEQLEIRKNELTREISIIEERLQAERNTQEIERERIHMENMDELAKLKLTRMKELEQYLEDYREECFANIQADYERQKALNKQRAKEEAAAVAPRMQTAANPIDPWA